jgi:hypothetical protein
MFFALVGRAGSGKDTVARMLQKHLVNAELISFAEPLKDFCQYAFDFSDEQIRGPSASRDAPDLRYRRADGAFLTPRYALQTLGTEWGRNCYPDVWVDLALRRVEQTLASGRSAIITDCRFLNEAARVSAAGGCLVRIVRPGVKDAAHVSETEQDATGMAQYITCTVHNDGTLDYLRERVASVLESVRAWKQK